MKTFFLAISTGLLTAASASAQTSADKTITVSGTRFTYPLVQQWISDFAQQRPDVKIRLVQPKDSVAAHADVHIVAAPLPAHKQQEGSAYVSVARYALLPVANSGNAYAQGKPVSVPELRRLYFDDAKTPAAQNTEAPVTVYNRLEEACAPVTFAAFYGASFEDIKGKSVIGDDQHLLKAVQQDEKAISFNNPGFIYDLQTRQPVSKIAVIPIDLNGNGRLDASEAFYGNLDQLIQRLENDTPDAIPVADVIFYYDKALDNSKPWLKEWIAYVQGKGQERLHAFGFLQTTRQSLAKRNK